MKQNFRRYFIKSSLPRHIFRAMIPVAAAGLLSVSTAQAAVTYSGNLNPTTDPSTWTTSTTVRVGDSADGTLTIDGGSAVSSKYSYQGYNADITGTATVTGSGSKWTTTYFNATRYVGYSGIGVLNITNGGYVNNKTAYISYNAGSTGTVTVDGPGSTWSNSAINVGQGGTGTLNIFNGSTVSATGATTVGKTGVINFGNSGGTLTTGGISVSASQLSGVGTINTSGIVSDVALVFDGSHGASKAFSFNSVAVNLSQSSSGALGAGYLGSGTLTIAGGVSVASNGGDLGYHSGSTGTATVTGTGSTWNGGNGTLNVGNSGTGSLSITNGAAVSNNYAYIGANSGATGNVTVNGAGSKWNNGNFYVGGSGAGSLSITNGAAVSGSAGYLGSASGSTGVATVDGAGSKWTSTQNFYVGDSGTGTLNITNGATVSAPTSYIAGNGGSKGTVTVDGAGSTWTSSNGLFIGNSGAGTLNISNGAAVVTGGNAIVGTLGTINFGSNGGAFTMSGNLYLGGKLSIGEGGLVTAANVNLSNSSSILAVDVGRGSAVTVGSTGTGTLTNNGTIRVVAGANAANGAYKPITAGTWAGTGSVQAVGGIWDNTDHTVTVSSAALANDGEAKTIDLATTQRYLFTNSATGKSAGAAFQAGSTQLTLTATSISGSELSSLQALLAPGKSVLSGWDFTATGYNGTDPVYLSLFAGSGHGLSDLTIWHYDGSSWDKFAASDFAYDNTYASFTVTGFSGYAVSGTAPVPVPPAVFLFGSGLSGLFFIRRRRSVAD